MATAAVAQKPSQKSGPTPGVVSGKVFAITNSGDLKPARMASVYVLYVQRSVKVTPADSKDGESAAIAWGTNLNKALGEFNKELEKNLEAIKRRESGQSDDMLCRRELMAYQKALVDTLQWAGSEHKEWQVVNADADEDGAFRIPLPHSGTYRLIAHGRAGFNDAFWTSDDFFVAAGSESSVKLSQPEKSCLAIGH